MAPEEKVRQFWIERMVQELGYPRSLFVVEKEIALLPHLSHLHHSAFPKRRVDILVYHKQAEEVCPLLLIECKAGALQEKHAQQLLGYNHFIRAAHIALVNERACLFASGSFTSFTEGMLSFSQLQMMLFDETRLGL